jgi:hypothetical protein
VVAEVVAEVVAAAVAAGAAVVVDTAGRWRWWSPLLMSAQVNRSGPGRNCRGSVFAVPLGPSTFVPFFFTIDNL